MFRDRHATSIENHALRLTVLHEGGQIAEILDKHTGINPLWLPPWPSIEPSTYDPARHSEYGGGVDASLLAGIMASLVSFLPRTTVLRLVRNLQSPL